MAVFDIRSNFKFLSSFDAPISADSIVFGNIIDTSDYELGLMFFGYQESYSDGTYDVTFQQSDTGAFAGEETVIPDQNLIGDAIIFNGSEASFDIQSQGIFSNLQFVRPVITASSVTAGALIVLMSIEGAEEKPDQDDVIGN